jgi:hypothetical protein
MEMLKIRLGPPGLGKQIMGTDSSSGIGHEVVETNSMVHCKGPQGGISDIRPMDGSMKEHGPGNGHYGLDRPFCNSIVMVGANSSELRDLGESLEVLAVCLGCKCSPIVTEIFSHNYTVIATVGLEGLLGFDSFMGIHVHLMAHKNETRGMIHKNGTTRVLQLGILLAVSMSQPASCGTNKMIN